MQYSALHGAARISARRIAQEVEQLAEQDLYPVFGIDKSTGGPQSWRKFSPHRATGRALLPVERRGACRILAAGFGSVCQAVSNRN